MAALNGDNYAKGYVNVPAEQAKAGEVGGKVKVLLDKYTGTPTAADTVKIGKLPKGARVLELKSIGAGTGASFSVTAGAIMSSETTVSVTIGTSPSADPIMWVYYIVD